MPKLRRGKQSSRVPISANYLASPPSSSPSSGTRESSRKRTRLQVDDHATPEFTSPSSEVPTVGRALHRLRDRYDFALRPDRGQILQVGTSADRNIQKPATDFIVAFDIGTTFTTVAFSDTSGTGPPMKRIGNFSWNPRTDCNQQLPTESWYPLPTKKTGSDFQDDKREPSFCKDYLHGYEVEYRGVLGKTNRDVQLNKGRVTRMKLLLDQSELTKELRADLNKVLHELKTNKLIKKDEDVLRDFLIVLMLHTLEQLEVHYGLTSQSKVQVVFCVPVCWPAISNYTLSSVFEEAMLTSGFALNDAGLATNLFVVNEAEAASTYSLKMGLHHLKRNEVFVLLDCGGGTVDVGTYLVGQEEPLRLEREVIQPQGALCGASYLNHRMRVLALKCLEPQAAALQKFGGMSIEDIVEVFIMREFENVVKKQVDFEDKRQKWFFPIAGLKASATDPSLRDTCFVLTHYQLLEIFEPCMREIEKLMVSQIKATQAMKGSKLEVDKVVLVGGFGDSPALVKRLRKVLDALNEEHQTHIQLIQAPPNESAMAVAFGALLRAADKTNGPKRIPTMSIGLLQDIPYEPEVAKEQPELKSIMAQRPNLDKHDNLYYIRDTIEWIIKKGKGPLASVVPGKRLVTHTFPFYEKNWTRKMPLYVSDQCTEDGYKLTSEKNKGKVTKLGNIVLDLTHLKGHVERQRPARGEGLVHCDVQVLVEIELIDRDMKFRVRWPAENGEVVNGAQKSFSVAAAFEPGTE